MGGTLSGPVSLTLFSCSRCFALSDICVVAKRPEERWMSEPSVILLGIATTRPVMGIFFATSRLTHLEQGQFFGVAFLDGFLSIPWSSSSG